MRLILSAALLLAGTPAFAGNTLIEAGTRVPVAKSALSVQPGHEWNKLTARPGKAAEEWTLDGHALNDLTFYGGIENDHPLLREVSKHDKPLPRFSSTMLVPDIVQLFESSYRIAGDTSLFTVDSTEPARLAGHAGFRFTYSFTRVGEEVARRGEGVGAVVGGKLYLITFEAPSIYYFDRDVNDYRAIVESATLGA